jgi:hypothetical protein
MLNYFIWYLSWLLYPSNALYFDNYLRFQRYMLSYILETESKGMLLYLYERLGIKSVLLWYSSDVEFQLYGYNFILIFYLDFRTLVPFLFLMSLISCWITCQVVMWWRPLNWTLTFESYSDGCYHWDLPRLDFF